RPVMAAVPEGPLLRRRWGLSGRERRDVLVDVRQLGSDDRRQLGRHVAECFAAVALTFRNSARRRCSMSRCGISNFAETVVASPRGVSPMTAILLVAIPPICRAAPAASVYLPDRAASSSASRRLARRS